MSAALQLGKLNGDARRHVAVDRRTSPTRNIADGGATDTGPSGSPSESVAWRLTRYPVPGGEPLQKRHVYSCIVDISDNKRGT